MHRNDNIWSRHSLLPFYFLFGGVLLGIGAMLMLAEPMRNASEDATIHSAISTAVSTIPPSVAPAAATRLTPVLPTITPKVPPTFVPTSVPSATAMNLASPSATVAPMQPSPPPVVLVIPALTAPIAPLHLSPGTRIQVTYDGGEGVHLRDGPNQGKVAALLKGSSLTVRGEAHDEAGFRWWPVEVEAGWIAEGPGDSTQPRWLTPMLSPTITVSQPVRVAYTGTDGLNLRRAPGPSNETLATLLHGSSLTVVGDPQTIDGITWWPVQMADGWLSEGSTDLHRPRWIAPITP